MEIYERIDFNRAIFVRNDDNAYKIAVMFSRFPEISKARQEILFFAHKSLMRNNINFLTYTELFNETLNYTNNWLLELDNLKDEYDWEFHRSKLLTRFSLKSTIDDTVQIMEFMKNQGHTNEGILIHNTAVSWNNGIYYAKKDKYKDNSDSTTWELWDIIKKYKKGDLDTISGNKQHLKELRKLIKYRKQDKFFDDHRSTLTDKDFGMIEELENTLSKIIFKEELTKEIPIISAVRKRLKL
jgi:hypothetical protein